MSHELKKILNSFDKILSENKSFVSEVSASSTELFGGKNVKIPRAGAHAGQKGWQSSNAWDIMAPIGTPVYALADGVAQTFSDYGRSIIKTQGKKLYGQSFTVKSDGGLPDVYYTHLEGSPIKKGSKIQCGQFLGYIMDMPNSSADHVHIGVSRGDISQFLDSNGKLKCGGGGITGEVGDYQPQKDTDDAETTIFGDSGSKVDVGGSSPLDAFGTSFGGFVTLREGFGRDVVEKYGSITIPAKSNEKIKSPVPGKVIKSKYSSSCLNAITIKIDKDAGYLQYCGISSPSVSEGKSVKEGTVLGKTSNDVEVLFFDKNFSRSYLKDNKFEKVSFVDDEEKPLRSKTDRGEPRYYDPASAFIPQMIINAFKDKTDPKTGKVEKRMGYATDKRDVDPWIVSALSKPFEKLGKALGTNKSSKLKEDIQRIKGLLK